MVNLSISGTLQQAFSQNNITLEVESDHFLAKQTPECTKEKIVEIIKSVSFYPLISEKKVGNKFAFTVIPFKIPDFFDKDTANYITLNEASQFLKDKLFIGQNTKQIGEKWTDINYWRSYVSSSLTQGIFDILDRYAKDDHPIIEIGSGIGYTLPQRLSGKTIRTQPNLQECHSLSNSISRPVYRTDIEGIYKSFVEKGKKVPLLFALNVFDVLSVKERKQSFVQISEIQNSGDHLVIMLDTNPYVNEAQRHLESLFPGNAIYPYCSQTMDPTKLSVIIVPLTLIKKKISPSEFDKMYSEDAKAIVNGKQLSKTQQYLHKLQRKHDLKVIKLEDLFATQVKQELEESGYTAEINYHISFTTGTSSHGYAEQDLMYKPVTDIASIRQWSLKDEKLLNFLGEKNLRIPDQFNEEFLLNLKMKRQNLFGAEILVIAAKKT